uniref:Reverse transcriptase zinc-binding domain-containing protein n=1 Tax=Arundo donax TaxID=35708 RepID=A0A0A9CHE7_ARUDO
MFSRNTREQQKVALMQELEITVEARNEKYLGLPVYMGRSIKSTFAYLKERVWKRIQGWKEKLLSKARKDILIKAIAQAMPSYAMSCFDLTKTLCDEISTMICRFWWAQQDQENKVHWLSWEVLTWRKKRGGLGFRDLHLFNLAMLARQGWRLLMNPESLCARVLKAKYFANGQLLNVQEAPGISYAWRSIVRVMQALKEGLIWRVGDGTQINIWNDPWVPAGTKRRHITPRGRVLLTRVSELIDPTTGEWDSNLIREVFWEEDVQNILAIPVRYDMEDSIAWHNDIKGTFSVKSAYHVLDDERVRQTRRQSGESSSSISTQSVEFNWQHIWKLPCPPKVKQFIWRLAHNSLPVRKNIARRGIELDTRCPVCSRFDEDGGHCFLKCKFVRKCWMLLHMEDIRVQLTELSSPQEMLHKILFLEERKRIEIVLLLWTWWEARNKVNVGDPLISIDQTLYRIRSMAAELISKEAGNTTRKRSDSKKWAPPIEGVIKINVDGSFLADQKKGSWGFIARDHEGLVLLAGAGTIYAVHDAQCAEMAACRMTLEATAANGMTRIIIETDCSIMVTALKSNAYDQALAGVWFRDARIFMSLNFSFVDIVFILRDL